MALLRGSSAEDTKMGKTARADDKIASREVYMLREDDVDVPCTNARQPSLMPLEEGQNRYSGLTDGSTI